MPDHNEREIAEALQVRRRSLVDALARLTEPPEAGANVSFGKRIGEGTTAAVERISTTAAARALAATLADVDRALAKVAEGTYGRCDSCGRRITKERLEAVPTTALCLACSSRRP